MIRNSKSFLKLICGNHGQTCEMPVAVLKVSRLVLHNEKFLCSFILIE
jgi:hypothetical protein